MSRSDYTDEDENNTAGLWRGAVKRAIEGKRGQALMRELAAALDAMPEKVLAAESLVTPTGEFCTLGVVGNARKLPLEAIDPEDWGAVAKVFGIAPALVREIVYENDERGSCHKCIAGQWTYVEETPQARWQRMRAWVQEKTIKGGAK